MNVVSEVHSLSQTRIPGIQDFTRHLIKFFFYEECLRLAFHAVKDDRAGDDATELNQLVSLGQSQRAGYSSYWLCPPTTD